MQNYHELLQEALDHGVDQYNVRTGEVCRTLVGRQLKFDLRDGFPAITTKKLAFQSMRGELLGFFRGYTNAADFRALGCNVWDANANKTEGWLNNPYRKGVDDLGPIYGKQWTDWIDRRIVSNDAEKRRLLDNGYSVRMEMQGEYLMQRSINQLENALRTLITNPSDRRAIISGWNVAELDMMALPPCHMDYRFVALESKSTRKTLHVVMTIRSWDLFLGAPFNIASTALFLEIMSRLAGMQTGTVAIQATNAHLYANHFDAAREQISRAHFAAPRIHLSNSIGAVSVDQIPGAFSRINPEDIDLVGYESHATIKAKMAE